MLDNEQLCKVRGVGGRAEVELGYGVGEQLYLRVIDEEEVAQRSEERTTAFMEKAYPKRRRNWTAMGAQPALIGL